MTFKINNKILFLALLLGLLLRLLMLNKAISFDEFVQTRAVLEANNYGLDKYTEMNPLTTWTRILITKILGIKIWSLRLTSLIFASLTALITYLISKKIYGTKTARIAVMLLSLSALHVLVSTSISFDGAFLTFYSLLTLYYYVLFEEEKRTKWLVLCGVSLGLSILTKYTGALIGISLFAYSLIRFKNLKETIKQFLIIGISSIVIFSIFPLAVLLSHDPSYFWITLTHGKSYLSERNISIMLLLIQYALSIIWIGPFLLLEYFLSWKRINKKDWLSHTTILTIFLFYTFIVQDPFRPVERYFTVFLPLLCILASKNISSQQISKKQWKLFCFTFLIFLVFFIVINNLSARIIPFYPKTGYIDAVLSLNWNFLVPFTGDQGPIGIYINFIIIALAFIGSALLLLIKKNRMVLLLGIGLAFSIFMIFELSLSLTSPDITKVVKETTAIAKNYSEPYYIFRDYAIQYYLGHNATIFNFDSDPGKISDLLNKKGGTLAVIDFPKLNRNGEIWRIFQECEPKHTISDKRENIGYIFKC